MSAAHPIVRATSTVVYRTPGGRRYFTKGAAYHRAAWERIAKKHPCDCSPGEINHAGGVDDTGGVCRRHAEREHFGKVAARLARLLARADRRTL